METKTMKVKVSKLSKFERGIYERITAHPEWPESKYFLASLIEKTNTKPDPDLHMVAKAFKVYEYSKGVRMN